MRTDKSFSDRKLSTEEFIEKYWMGGKAPYQYHTGTIEDGRDEREQFVFNNIRSLKEQIVQIRRNGVNEGVIEEQKVIQNSIKDITKRMRILAVMSFVQTIIILLILLMQLLQQNLRNK